VDEPNANSPQPFVVSLSQPFVVSLSNHLP
jgi:hypothetical protein